MIISGVVSVVYVLGRTIQSSTLTVNAFKELRREFGMRGGTWLLEEDVVIIMKEIRNLRNRS